MPQCVGSVSAAHGSLFVYTGAALSRNWVGKTERTLDWGMTYGHDRSVSILLEMVVGVVPIGPVGVARSRWALGRR